MTFSGKIRIFVAVLLICILPYGAFSQNTEKARKGFWHKKERVEKTITEEENAKEKKLLGIFNRRIKYRRRRKLRRESSLGFLNPKGKRMRLLLLKLRTGNSGTSLFSGKRTMWLTLHIQKSTGQL